MKIKRALSVFLVVSVLISILSIPISVGASTVGTPSIPITIGKTATPVAGKPGQFDVSLSVTTSATAPADVVIVLDNSDSMQTNSCGSTSNFIRAQQMVTSIIRSLLTKNVRLGIVTFTNSAQILTTITDLNSDNAGSPIKAIESLTCSTILDDGHSKPGSQTNIKAGIEKASAILSDKSYADDNKAIILISDGKANIAYDGIIAYTGDWPSSISYNNFSKISSLTSNTARNSKLTIYSVGFYGAGDTTNSKYASLMTNCANKGYSVLSADGSNVQSIAQNITDGICPALLTAATVTDQISTDFTLADKNGDNLVDDYDCTSSFGTVSFAPTDSPGKIIWDIGDVAPNQAVTLSYRVKIRDDAVSGLAYPISRSTTLSYTDPLGQNQSQSFSIPQVSVGKVTVCYSCEQADGTTRSLGSESILFETDSGYTLTAAQRDAKLGDAGADYDSSQTVVSPASVSIDPNAPTADHTISVEYKLKRGNVAIEYYRDTLDQSNKLTDSSPGNYLTFARVGTTLSGAPNLSEVQLSKLKPDENYGSGAVISYPSAISSDPTQNVVKVLYTRLQPGLAVKVDFRGGPLAGSHSYDRIDTLAQAGKPVKLDGYKLDTTQGVFGGYSYTGSSFQLDGVKKETNENYTMPNAPGASITLTYEYKTAKVTVVQDYPGGGSTTTRSCYQDTPYSLSNLENANDEGGRFTHTVVLGSGCSVNGDTVTFTGDAVITLTYTHVTKNITVVHRYPDGTEVSGKIIPENYLSENLDQMIYYNQVQLNTQNGKFKFSHYSDTTAFNLTGDKALYIVYGWGDANISVVHDYPDKADVTDPIIPAHFNDEIVVGKAAIPQTQSGTYEVAGYNIDGSVIKSTDKFTVNQTVTTITITYKNVQAGISVIHKYPADSGKADITDSTIYQNVGTTVDLSKVVVKTDDSRFVFDSFSPSADFTLPKAGAVVTVNYKWVTGKIKVNFVGQTLAADGSLLSSKALGSIDVTENVGSRVTTSDFASGRTYPGYGYKSADPAEFTLTKDGKTVTLIYIRQADTTTVPDNDPPAMPAPTPSPTSPSIDSSLSGMQIALLSDSSTPKSSNPQTGGNSAGEPQALLVGLLSASLLCGGTAVVKRKFGLYRRKR